MLMQRSTMHPNRDHSRPRFANSQPRCSRTSHIRAAASSDGRNGDQPLPLPTSLFTPYTSLPSNGQLIPRADEMCDVMVSNCKELTYVYETKCSSCCGTGYARSRNMLRRGRGRGSLSTCLVCTGMGHVRRTTARYLPQVEGDLEHMTLARQQRLPGEPEQQTLPSAPPVGGTGWAARLRQAAQQAVKQGAKPAPGTVPDEPSTEKTVEPALAATAAAQQNGTPQARPVNNIVSSSGLAGQAPKQPAATSPAAQ